MTAAAAGGSPAERLRAQRAALLDGPLPAAELRAALVAAADAWLGELLGDEPGVALLAVGGYGRRDPAPHSDLDLVLVHAGRADVAALADRVWYPVWDAGVGLDHSVRTVPEVVAVAREDLKAALGLLDARLVAGDAELAAQARSSVLDAWRRGIGGRAGALVELTRARWATAGEVAFLLEPDLKDSRGGLRDLTVLRALAAAWVADPPAGELLRAEQRLLDARTALHRRAGRAQDRLLLQEQEGVAAELGLGDDAADELAHALAAGGRAVAYALDVALRRAAPRPATRGGLGRWGRRGPVRRPLAEGVVEQDGEAVLARDTDPGADAGLSLRAAAAAAQAGVPLGVPLLDRLEAAPALPEPWPESSRDDLVALLGSGPAAVEVVEALDQHGVWERLLPEWGHVRSRPQRNAVHRFTVDRHLLETAVAAAARARDVARPDLLLLAGLLHDIGKGRPGDHSVVGAELAAAAGRRMGLPADDVDSLATLVRHHLLLADTATRRDLEDPATVRAVATAVGTREALDLLHALTVADALATGPAAWSDWKAGLVAELVARTADLLAGSPLPAPRALTAEQEALVDRGALAVAVEGAQVTVVAPDRPGLLARVAGVLALHRLDVRSASASHARGMAVTVLEAHPRFGSPPDWALVRGDVRRALEAPEWLAHRLAERERDYAPPPAPAVPPRVLLLDDASDRASVVEVRAHDRLGLLHALTRALAAEGLDVRAARISTLGAEAVDAFYVGPPGGGKLVDPAQRDRVVASLLAAAG